MHPHLRKALALALHPGTCDGEASAAFSAARRLVAKNGSPDLPDAEAEIVSCADPHPHPRYPGAGTSPAPAPEQHTVWRVSIRADRLHEFLGMLIEKAKATDVRLTLQTFGLLGRHVHTPTRLEFALTGERPCVDLVGGWIATYVAGAGFRVRHHAGPPRTANARGESAYCAQ
jgi:hypothetical protein